MKSFLLLTGAAALAVSMPAVAEQGQGKGGGKGGGHAAHNAKPDKAQRQANNPGKGQGQKVRTAQGRGNADRKPDRRIRADDRRDDRVRQVRFDDRRDKDDDFRRAGYRDFDGRGACPPGLDKKDNGCLPPGQAKKIFARGERFDFDRYRDYNVPLGYRSFYSDTPDYYYRYGDNGYIYRIDRDTSLVSGLIPLLGGGFTAGQMLPAGYGVYNVPLQYRDMWYDTDDRYYRYGDNAIYGVDPESMMIENIVALMTGDRFGVGQAMPAGYDIYNVPYQYRDTYYDTPQYNYRYADGYIYQVDPQTQIIQAIISALI